MTMPYFTPGDDPGSSFPELLRRTGAPQPEFRGDATSLAAVPHATTCVALRFADGVVMAGDRRATAGNLISHRTMEKVVEADRHSAVAVAGAAGPATEMVRLFQLQLEHYEKVEGTPLSLEGKANQLSQMIRGNLQAAMMGLGVVPIFAGYDLRRQVGRLFAYDITGGRYEERGSSRPDQGACTPGRSSSSGTARVSSAPPRSIWPAGRCGKPPTPTPPPAARTRSGGSTRSSPRSPRTASSESPTTSWRSATRRSPTPSARSRQG